jgi:hypothetical protein
MNRGFSSVGRASALHAEGQGFDSPNLHSVLPSNVLLKQALWTK